VHAMSWYHLLQMVIPLEYAVPPSIKPPPSHPSISLT
jgi:hypothetical protein